MECNDVIDVLEWVLAERQGTKKGKQNTQLELGKQQLPVGAVVCRLIKALEDACKHQVTYEWRNHMRKIDTTMSNPDKHRVLLTDFGATLDLRASETDNCSVDNHAVICIFLLYMTGVELASRIDKREMS